MPDVEAFVNTVLAECRSRLALLDDDADRGSTEDTICLLTDYRLHDMDDSGLSVLLASLSAGRSPVAIQAARPEMLGRELATRWAAYCRKEEPATLSA